MSIRLIQLALEQQGLSSPMPLSEFRVPSRNGRRVRLAGVYVLLFSNGDYYVGETLDMGSRLKAHGRRFRDISHLSFHPVARTAGWKAALRKIEKDTLWALHEMLQKQGVQSRGIKGPRSRVACDLDEVLTADEAAYWESGIDYELSDDERDPAPEARVKYAERFQRFTTNCMSAEDITAVVKAYVEAVIPRPNRSEAWFWNVSCQLERGLLTRLNVGWQTTLDVFEFEDGVRYDLYLTEQLLKELVPRFSRDRTRKIDLKEGESSSATLHFTTGPIDLVKGGPRQVRLSTFNPEVLARALRVPAIRSVLRRFAGGLMQQDSCPWGESHCWQMLD